MYSNYDNPSLPLKDVLSNGVTFNCALFESLVTRRRNRVHIVTEGDSWFDYPIKKHQDIVDWIVESVGGTDLANVLRLASRGDTLEEITTLKQESVLRDVLADNRKRGPVDFLLFSAGGNDLIQDLKTLLTDYDRKADYAAKEDAKAYIDTCQRLRNKLEFLKGRYVGLCTTVKDCSPETTVIAHSYSYFVKFGDDTDHLLKPNAAGPWIDKALKARDVPRSMWKDVVRELVDRYYETLCRVLDHADVDAPRFKIVDTRNLLTSSDWADEIHPNDAGFHKVAHKIYEQMIDRLGESKRLPEFAGR